MLSAGALALAGVAAALQLWGLPGIAIAIAALGAFWLVVLKVSARTERLYRAKSQNEGTPVFAALLGGTAGGDLVVGPDDLRFLGGRRRTPSFAWAFGELRCVRVARKGSIGSAALMTVEMVAGDRVRLEVADGPRLAKVLTDVVDLAVEIEWDD